MGCSLSICFAMSLLLPAILMRDYWVTRPNRLVKHAYASNIFCAISVTYPLMCRDKKTLAVVCDGSSCAFKPRTVASWRRHVGHPLSHFMPIGYLRVSDEVIMCAYFCYGIQQRLPCFSCKTSAPYSFGSCKKTLFPFAKNDVHTRKRVTLVWGRLSFAGLWTFS